MFSDAELEKIVDAQINEYVRGAEVLYWDDVEVGSALPGTVRGPINQLDMTTPTTAAPSAPRAGVHQVALEVQALGEQQPGKKLPNNYDKSYYGAKGAALDRHHDARGRDQVDLGMPGPYDNGPAALRYDKTTVATNLDGATAASCKVSALGRDAGHLGDCNFFKGRQDGQAQGERHGAGGPGAVGENQFGQVTIKGSAVVELPCR